jgi:hypothetical protein
MKLNRRGVLVSLAPALLALLLFASLAMHMRLSLGQWPQSIGSASFPPALHGHATIAFHYFWWLLLPCACLTPVIALVCLAVPRWRGLFWYVAIFAAACTNAIALMQLAPEPFLHWWKD